MRFGEIVTCLLAIVEKDAYADDYLLTRNKNCCHPFVAGDVFRFMSILIKLSNHLGLILPGAHIVM
jgi:hypothetical protein